MGSIKAVLAGGIALGAIGASGQTATGSVGNSAPLTTTAASDAPAEEIIVTGTRISRPGLDAPVPVTVITAAELTQTGQVSIGDVLNDLPALRTTLGSANSTRFIGTAGLNELDLRGLGTTRTLVLVNGRRHVPASLGSNEVDTNQIPTDLVERVDIVTGGNSAVYGSDAIAGVVNFQLKRSFDGIQLRGQAGLSDRKDAASNFISLTAGTNFADGRGNIAFSGEYAKQDALYDRDRPSTAQRGAFVVVDTDPSGSDGNPDRIFVRDTRAILLSDGGTFRPGCPTAGTANPLRCTTSSNGTRVERLFRFRPDGTLTEADYGRRDFRTFANSSDGGDGETLRGYLQLQPSIERYTANILGRFEITPAIEPYVEAKYVRTETFGSQSGPFFSQPYNVSIDNPFLSDQARTLIQTLRPGLTTVGLNRNYRDFGARGEDNTRDTYRIVGGVRGEFAKNFNYDLSVNYGEFDELVRSRNNVFSQRFDFAADAVRDPTTGQIVCRVKLAPPDPDTLDPALSKFVAGDIAACVPINLFGAGAPSQAALDYVRGTTTARGKQTQFVVSGSVSGDTSSFYEFPIGGAPAFSIGGEYRRETAFQEFSEIVRLGGTFLNAIPTFKPPAFEVKEGFAELILPLIKNQPFAHELTVSGAARVANYRGGAGTVWAYNGGATWAPVRDLRIRFNYGRSVRAPNLSELYQSPTQNFASVTDPCDTIAIGAGAPTRPGNCAAAGIPAGFVNDSARAATIEITSAGNPNLKAETSDSYTIGAAIQPRLLRGLTVSVDYYDIEVNSVIAGVPVQTVLNNCYDGTSLNNVFCGLFKRLPAGSIDPLTGLSNAFEIVPGSLQDTTINYASRRARGLDFDVAYQRDLGRFGNLSSRVIFTYVLQRDNYPFIDDPRRRDQITFELGDPEIAFNAEATWKIENFFLNYQLRFIGKQVLNFAEDIYTVAGRPPQNLDYADRRFYQAVAYHSIRAGVKLDKRFEFYGGVDNLTDKLPPLGLTGVGAGSGIFDNKGRYLYIGATARWGRVSQ